MIRHATIMSMIHAPVLMYVIRLGLSLCLTRLMVELRSNRRAIDQTNIPRSNNILFVDSQIRLLAPIDAKIDINDMIVVGFVRVNI